MKRTFMVWDAEYTEEDALPVKAHDDADAAEREAERRWHDGDYPDEQTFYVRDEKGVLTKWTVKAERW